MTRRRTPATTQGATHLQRARSWAGLREGDRVDLLEPHDQRVAWSFMAHVTNVESGESWVEVVGDRAGEQRRRSVHPAQVFPHRSVRRGTPTAASLDAAPRLPL